MRKIFALLVCVLVLCVFGITSRAQVIPNAGLESWAGGEPVSWTTTNDPGPPAIVNVTQTNDAHAGFAAQGIVANVSGFGFPAVLWAGQDGDGFPINARPAALRGWFKFTSVGGDILLISSGFQKNGTTIGAGSFIASASTSTYREFYANTVWGTGETPDTAYIIVQISPGGGTWHTGTTFWVDDFSYGAAGDVRDETAGIPSRFALHQNYPNPFNPSTSIRYEIPTTSIVSLKVFDMVGQEVATLAEGERTAGVYIADLNAANLASGTYIYRLQAGSFSQVKKLALVK